MFLYDIGAVRDTSKDKGKAKGSFICLVLYDELLRPTS